MGHMFSLLQAAHPENGNHFVIVVNAAFEVDPAVLI
jgi:hypothetical protein